MNKSQYIGDIDPNGEATPFRVATMDNINGPTLALLNESNAIKLSDPIDAQGMLIRGATSFRDAADFQRHRYLSYLIRVGVGTTNIDMQHANNYGVATLNTPGASTNAVAQRAVTLMLASAAKVPQATSSLQEGRWEKSSANLEPVDLSEKTLGIIGYGRIGRKTAEYARPFVKEILAFDPVSIPGNGDSVEQVNLEKLLSESDVLSVSVGGDQEVLTEELLLLLKQDTILINTSRGDVVNKEGLLKMMNERGIRVGLDVYWKEGNTMFDDPIMKQIAGHSHFVGTPHTAASDEVTQRKLGLEAATNMVLYAKSGSINPSNLPGHTLPRIPLTAMSNGVRGVITHPSKPGVLETISSIIAKRGHNIRGLVNEESHRDTKDPMALTAFDIEDIEPKEAARVLQAIQSEVVALRSRLLLFMDKTSVE